MHDVCSPQETCVFREDAITNEETRVNIQSVAPNDDMFRNTLANNIVNNNDLSHMLRDIEGGFLSDDNAIHH